MSTLSVQNITGVSNLSISGAIAFANGTSSIPSISSSSSPSTGIFFPVANTIAFTEGGIEAARIDSVGNFGIGTTSPGQKLEVQGDVYINGGVSGQGAYILRDGASGGAAYSARTGSVILSTPTADAAIFRTNNTERMRIDSSGNIGIGTASPAYKFDAVGSGRFSGTQGVDFVISGGAGFTRSVIFSTNNVPRGILFLTNTAETGSNAGSELTLGVYNDAGQYSASPIIISRATGAITSLPTYNNTAAGSTVVVTSAGDIRRTSSSIKYKKDIENLDPALADHAVDNLRPVWYRSKEANGDDKTEWSHIGLIAEEVDLVEKRLVRYRTVEVTTDENGQRTETPLDTPEPEDVDYARLSVLLLDVVKRQKMALSALEARVAALETK